MAWTWSDEYRDGKFVVLLGVLHIEMAFLGAIGDFLKGSGWKEVLTYAGVSTEERVDCI